MALPLTMNSLLKQNLTGRAFVNGKISIPATVLVGLLEDNRGGKRHGAINEKTKK
jgi:hypothetical protein